MPKRTATINHPSSSTKKADNKAEDTNVEEEKMKFSDLKDLIYLGRCEKLLKISGYTFLMQTLTASDQRALLGKVMDIGSSGSILDAKPMTLSYSILEINGVPPPALYAGDEDLEDREKALYVFMNMQTTLIDTLYKEYEGLLDKSNKSLDIDDLKA